MNEFFPISQSITSDSELVQTAINSHEEELQQQKIGALSKRISRIALKILSAAALILSLAAVTTLAMFSFTTLPLLFAGASLSLTIGCFATLKFLDYQSPAEQRLKIYWKNLFDALANGNGEELLAAAEKLIEQKKQDPHHFHQTVDKLKNLKSSQFFHNICAIAFLLKAIASIHQEQPDSLLQNARNSLIHFESSALPLCFGEIATKMLNQPEAIQQLVKNKQIGDRDIRSIDYLIYAAKNDAKMPLYENPPVG